MLSESMVQGWVIASKGRGKWRGAQRRGKSSSRKKSATSWHGRYDKPGEAEKA